GARALARDLLLSAAAPARAPATALLTARPDRRRAAHRAGAVARAALRGSDPRRGLRHPARRGCLSLLGTHDVPTPGAACGGAGAAESAPASRLCRPGTAGPPAQ